MSVMNKLKAGIQGAQKFFRPSAADALQERISGELERAAPLAQPDFPERLHLPENYGKGMPERTVELLLAKTSYRPGSEILDVGHANAMRCHLAMVRSLEQPRNITGMDIAAPTYDTRPYYRNSVMGDMTACPLADESFDLVWCISALEHIGMDNSAYTKEFKVGQEMMAKALREMFRVVRRGGSILVTVPFGKHEDHGWFINFGQQDWVRLLDNVRADCRIHEHFFRHTFGQGWTGAPARELEHVGYYDQCNGGAGGLAAAYLTRNP